MIFQSTPPRGRRQSLPPVSCRSPLNFNPRLREGGDSTGTRPVAGAMYFNPRLREGGDLTRLSLMSPVEFQSTPPRGRRLSVANNYIPIEIFQSTPPRGRRLHPCVSPPAMQYFNPRLREGGDLYFSSRQVLCCDFNPRLREGGDSIDY